MPRPALASLLVLAACATPARTTTTPPANVESVAQYSLVPLHVRGNEGRHSASHSSTTIRGELRLIGDRAELALDLELFVGHVRCPAQSIGRTMQACAPRDARDIHTSSRRVMRGTARTESGALRISVAGERDERDRRIEPDRMTITCRDSYLGFACAIEETNLFGFGVIAPRTMAFLSPGTKRFTIAPTDVPNVGAVSGSLAIEAGGALTMTLAVDGGAPSSLPGRVTWQDHGISLRAETSPTRNLGAL